MHPCPSCQAPLPQGVAYCPSCGQQIQWVQPDAAPPPVAPPRSPPASDIRPSPRTQSQLLESTDVEKSQVTEPPTRLPPRTPPAQQGAPPMQSRGEAPPAAAPPAARPPAVAPPAFSRARTDVEAAFQAPAPPAQASPPVRQPPAAPPVTRRPPSIELAFQEERTELVGQPPAARPPPREPPPETVAARASLPEELPSQNLTALSEAPTVERRVRREDLDVTAPGSAVVRKLAPLWRRLAAWTVDFTLLAALLWGFFVLASGLVHHGPPSRLSGLDWFAETVLAYGTLWKPALALFSILTVGYLALFTALGGQTPGKRVCRLEVVDKNGELPGLLRSVVRAFLALGSGLFVLMGFLLAFFDRRHQALHDKLAGTFVVCR